MLESYLNKTIGLRFRIGLSDCGEPLWSPPPTLPPDTMPALVLAQNSLSHNNLGESFSVTGTVLCLSPISPGDAVILDNELCPVTSVTPVLDLAGNILHYEAVIGNAKRTRLHGGLKITN